jgi:glycine cleavage system H protein
MNERTRAEARDDALPCVWMTAGLVTYKLCSRGFDCDGCPLDVALRGSHEPGSAAGVARALPRELRPDRKYHRTHLWVLPIHDHRIRCGLDGFAARLLDRLTAVVFPTLSSGLRRGSPACWLSDDGQPFALQSPLPGSVSAVNEDVRRSPGLIAQSPYDAGWLLEMTCDADLDDDSDLLSPNVMRERTDRDLEQLHREAAALLSQDVDVGPTLADGGELLESLRDILGVGRYHRIVGQFLS